MAEPTLRQQLTEALWTGIVANGGRAEPREGMAAERADVAIKVFAGWLREQSHLITDNYPDDEDVMVAAWIWQLADHIDPEVA